MGEFFRNYRPMLTGRRWMITADHPLAVQAAASSLAGAEASACTGSPVATGVSSRSPNSAQEPG